MESILGLDGVLDRSSFNGVHFKKACSITEAISLWWSLSGRN